MLDMISNFLTTVDDFVWGIPLIVLILATGLFLTARLRFLQITKLPHAIKHLIANEKSGEDGEVSSFAALCTALSATIGTGNIVGVATAIVAGGPGALFWMWISAFFGMAVAYMEGVLAQIFKEKKDDEFVGGLPFYGRKLLGNKVWIGVFLSVLYILYALCCLPAQGFNVVSSVGRMAEIVTGTTIASGSAFYYIVGALIVVLTAAIAFGGIKKVSKWTDMMVPVMAVLYMVVVLLLIILNFTSIP